MTEAVHAIERMADVLAQELKMDPAELRMKNFIPKEKFPYKSALGWEYDSGNYPAALQQGDGHDRLRGAAQGAGGEARPRRADGHRHLQLHRDRRRRPVEALRHPGHQDVRLGCEIRVHPTGKAIARFGTKSQGQGHETTYAQIIAEELGIPASQVQVEEGDTDTAPYGLGTYASRSTPTAGAAGAMAARKIREKARKIAAHLLEVSEDDLEWETGKFSVKGAPTAVEDHPGDRLRRLHQPPAGDGGRAGGGVLLRPAEPDLPLRQLHLRGGHRPRHRRW